MSCNQDVVLSLKHLKNLNTQVSDLIQDEKYAEINRILQLKDFVIETLIKQHKTNTETYSADIIELFEHVKELEQKNISVIKKKYDEVKKEKNKIDANNTIQTAYGNRIASVGSVLDVSE